MQGGNDLAEMPQSFEFKQNNHDQLLIEAQQLMIDGARGNLHEENESNLINPLVLGNLEQICQLPDTKSIDTDIYFPACDSFSNRLTVNVMVRMTDKGPKTVVKSVHPNIGLTKDNIRDIQEQIKSVSPQFQVGEDHHSSLITLTLNNHITRLQQQESEQTSNIITCNAENFSIDHCRQQHFTINNNCSIKKQTVESDGDFIRRSIFTHSLTQNLESDSNHLRHDTEERAHGRSSKNLQAGEKSQMEQVRQESRNQSVVHIVKVSHVNYMGAFLTLSYTYYYLLFCYVVYSAN